jgi:hypothetical protein
MVQAEHRQSVARIRRIDEAKRVVFGEVYAGMVMDTYGEFMLTDDVETMAHRFARLPLSETIDTNHDNDPNGCHPVESFIARDRDPDFLAGAWVLGIKVADDHIWAQVLKNELNGFSFEAMVKPVNVVAKVETVRDHVGETEPAGINDHRHLFFVHVNEFGRVVRGETSINEGHAHAIRTGTRTERADNHVHRFFL